MTTKLWAGILALAVVSATGSTAFAQRDDVRSGQSSRGSSRSSSGSSSGQGTLNYSDNSRRTTQKTERDEKNAKAAEEAKKKAEEERRRAEREKRYGQNNQNNQNGKATSMGTTQKPDDKKPGKEQAKKGGPATKPVNAGGSSDPLTKEVNEVILQAVQTQKVNFDPAEAKSNPNVLLLNAPKFDKTDRTRAGDANIASPL